MSHIGNRSRRTALSRAYFGLLEDGIEQHLNDDPGSAGYRFDLDGGVKLALVIRRTCSTCLGPLDEDSNCEWPHDFLLEWERKIAIHRFAGFQPYRFPDVVERAACFHVFRLIRLLAVDSEKWILHCNRHDLRRTHPRPPPTRPSAEPLNPHGGTGRQTCF